MYASPSHPKFSPWATGDPRAPPPLSIMGGIIFFSGPPGMILAMLPGKKTVLTGDYGHFSRWPPLLYIIDYISGPSGPRIVILVSIPMFLRSGNNMKAFVISLMHCIMQKMEIMLAINDNSFIAAVN